MSILRILAALDLSPLPRVGADENASVIQTILTIFWTVAGAISLLIITLAGLRFVISRGDPTGVAKAKNTIIYAVIGLVISITATIIVGFVFRNV